MSKIRTTIIALVSVGTLTAPAIANRIIETPHTRVTLEQETGECGAEFTIDAETGQVVDLFGTGVDVASDNGHENISCHGSVTPDAAAALGADQGPVRIENCAPNGIGCCDFEITAQQWSVTCNFSGEGQ